ncbi:four helix bundle protein [Candidatus Roizmanbacteria bacterium RIFCSPHIGHO2_01_FULL_39_12c]|uniref:Four helix bundle protein n=1 Tax=Candidatus Roizmanbacteria bacterium RIFCSPHIGHO2_01_FULL_39_12c TaxID=1802031 RepID=A0A1F7GBY0_9BACT|nr:MAG: four helix bundle protein [Candidatus Roizmanbacteria bacterium RIFCSPHIGHO2_01_FULL_39_12c]OGK46933.1 MAG: four helix bundle protein [Candidatus Roizmanbacteria bacterium RIFCSPLOWO2_01_FULL_40_13]
MIKPQNSKKFDLEDRTFKFAKKCRTLVKKIPKTISSIEDGKQLIRSSGSVHSNYIEANEAFSKIDFYHRVKICRKEVKESRSWLKLLDLNRGDSLDLERNRLTREAEELMRIFGSIITREKKF